MRKLTTRFTKLSVAALAIGLLVGCGIMREPLPPTSIPETVQVTADQIAQAMEADSFYSDYGNDILHVSGTVKSLNRQQAGTRIELATSVRMKVYCYVDDQAGGIDEGATITIESSEADREDNAVHLRPCKVISQ